MSSKPLQSCPLHGCVPGLCKGGTHKSCQICMGKGLLSGIVSLLEKPKKVVDVQDKTHQLHASVVELKDQVVLDALGYYGIDIKAQPYEKLRERCVIIEQAGTEFFFIDNSLVLTFYRPYFKHQYDWPIGNTIAVEIEYRKHY